MEQQSGSLAEDDPHIEVLHHTEEALAARDAVLKHTDKVLDNIDETLGLPDEGLFVRHPSVPSNMLGISFISPRAFNGDLELWATALSMEIERGAGGFAPNTVRFVYSDEGRLSLSALRQVVTNYATWRYTD